MAGKITKVWTEEEKQLFKIEFFKKTNIELEKLFNCTKKQVISQAKKLGLTKREPEPAIGDKFGRLTILEKFNKEYEHGNKTYVRCRCDCGNISEPRLTSLVQNKIISCGCWKNEKASTRMTKFNTTHGMGNLDDRLYRIWAAMRCRCNNPNISGYDLYGGRGIRVCEEWDDFQNFYDWSMNNGYTDELTIDRIDNNKGYQPDNCRWTTFKIQARNRRNNRLDTVKITAFGEIKSLQDWLDDERCKVSAGTTICYRIGAGWKPEDAISKPSERS